MAESNESRPTPLGIYNPPARPQLTGADLVALGLSGLWLLGSALAYWLMSGGEPGDDLATLRFLVGVLAIFLPVAMIWVAAAAARSSRAMREESAQLQAGMDALRQAYLAQNQKSAGGSVASVARKLDEIAAAQRKTETTLAMFTSSREPREASRTETSRTETSRTEPRPAAGPAAPAAPATRRPASPEEQPVLELGTPTEPPPLATSDLIRALNFPETAQDEEGFVALRRALRDRSAKQLVQAAQDVLTLLSQEGIYMDDLRPDMARPEIWRRFAAGDRGRTIAALGGVRDRSSLALTAARMKSDPIFRDAAHHFLRLFDRGFVAFEENASDSEIQALADTRTARAFMLLGRVAGTFN
ncbi:hypothetical protein E0K89_009140 [Aquicoccus sp. SCR17]|nr:hypothetical protein [Carideicomes alvinocaridis]